LLIVLKIGFETVRTYIQCGNIIVQSLEDKSKIELKLKNAIHVHFGFDVLVIATIRVELKRVFNTCPLSEEKKENSYFVILSEFPNLELIDELVKIIHDTEVFRNIKDCIYSSVGYGNSKFNMNSFKERLNVSRTLRQL
jgi:uncharacterized protein (DUF1697 family)